MTKPSDIISTYIAGLASRVGGWDRLGDPEVHAKQLIAALEKLGYVIVPRDEAIKS